MQLREHRAQIYPPGRRFAGPALPLLRTRRAKKLNLMTLLYEAKITSFLFLQIGSPLASGHIVLVRIFKDLGTR
jgi:hypothetical protein